MHAPGEVYVCGGGADMFWGALSSTQLSRSGVGESRRKVLGLGTLISNKWQQKPTLKFYLQISSAQANGRTLAPG